VSLFEFKETEYRASLTLGFLGYEAETASHAAFTLSIAKIPDDTLPIGSDEKFEMLEGIFRERRDRCGAVGGRPND
jgi:hypothetical protein